jgi:hypothetical protein
MNDNDTKGKKRYQELNNKNIASSEQASEKKMMKIRNRCGNITFVSIYDIALISCCQLALSEEQ